MELGCDFDVGERGGCLETSGARLQFLVREAERLISEAPYQHLEI
jgi:hypothetical protein